MKNLSKFFIPLFIMLFAFQAEAQNLNYISSKKSLIKKDPYHWANGKWLKRAKIEKGYVSNGVTRETKQQINDYFTDLFNGFENGDIPVGLEKVAAYYHSSLDTASRNLSQIQPWFTLIDGLKENLSNLPEILARMSQSGLDAPWGIWVGADEKNPTRNIMHLSQGGIPIAAEYFVTRDEEKILALKNHIIDVCRIAGFERNVADSAFYVVQELGQVSLTTTQLYEDPERLYNAYSIAELNQLYAFDWNSFFSFVLPNGTTIDTIIIEEPGFLEKIQTLNLSRNTWNAYLKWHILNQIGGLCSNELDTKNFEFYEGYMDGVKERKSLQKTALRNTMEVFPNTLGRLFIAKFYSKEKELLAEEMINNIKQVFNEEFQKGIWWMSDSARVASMGKLNSLVFITGYTKDEDLWPVENFEVTEILVENVLSNNFYLGSQNMQELFEAVRRDELSFAVYEVNAGYSPNLNNMQFPAGILLYPYIQEGNIAASYGAIGSIKAHEMLHAFDGAGSASDSLGFLKQWWSNEDLVIFDSLTSLIQGYCQKTLDPKGKIPDLGERVVNETIADLGIVFAFKAMEREYSKNGIDIYEKDSTGFSPAQIFFISYLQCWRQKTTKKFDKRMMIEDEHVVNRLRPNLIVKTMPEFYKAFGLKENKKITGFSKLVWSSQRPD